MPLAPAGAVRLPYGREAEAAARRADARRHGEGLQRAGIDACSRRISRTNERCTSESCARSCAAHLAGREGHAAAHAAAPLVAGEHRLAADPPVPGSVAVRAAWTVGRAPKIAAAVDVAPPGEKPAELDHALAVGSRDASRSLLPVRVACGACLPAGQRTGRQRNSARSLPGAAKVTPARGDRRTKRRWCAMTLPHCCASHPVPRERRHLVAATPPKLCCASCARTTSMCWSWAHILAGGSTTSSVGSTTERILDCLPCDVLVIKPASFVCPLRVLTDDA